jgi:hypothetical protein
MASAQEAATFAPKRGAWRHFQIVTKLQIAKPEGKTQAWIPLPAVNERDWFQSNGSTWRTNGLAVLKRNPKCSLEVVHVVWTAAEKTPVVEVTSNIVTRDRSIDLGNPGKVVELSIAARKALFGTSEMNPRAYNVVHDVAVPGSKEPGFLMYQQPETASMRLDRLDLDTFEYTILSKEVAGLTWPPTA